MVSLKTFKKFVPGKLKIPKAHCEVSFTKELSERERKKIEKVAEEGVVVYDTRHGIFYLEYNGKNFPIEIRDTDTIPDYMFNRIKVEVPKGLVPTELCTTGRKDKTHDEIYCYLNPFSRTWITPQRQAVPSAYEGRLWGYLSDLLKSEIVDFNSTESRKLKDKNRDTLSRYVTNTIANRR
ncbi:hypothetical protein J4205_03030 [Candidatus Pacearchaeota archaeon]|nr:hypothetical protein [Candidatus Pacearchaeota archaeon]